MHLPPWREGWISAKRKSPQKSNRMFLLAISLQNAPPLSRSAGFILFWLITTSPEVSKSDEKKKKQGEGEKREKLNVIMRGQTLWFSGSLCFISSSMSGVAVFILVTPASSTDAPASKERERERERETYRQIQRGRGSKKDPIQKELNWLPSICTDTEHTYLLQTEEEQTTNPDNYLRSVALIFSLLLFNTCSATILQLF